jgi:Tol biopolymer transport system component/serine/threonine protein kinase/tetratricopeptide (TPR) repeat protein
MGAVFLAERADGAFEQKVALKIIKSGINSEAIVQRFVRERQILASLDHPNIARLLDGGTTDDGLPYFIMEYIDGQPLYRYCDGQKLTIRERLRLFTQICSAVQYAHQNLVIHRDIKPGNILVTASGTPKLLDFGIAKILNPDLAAETLEPTSVAHRLMTPEYASPEQVRGAPATAASDIYSLGVLLYELLSGHRPYRLRNILPHEMARIICEEEPERPSTASNRVEEIPDAIREGTPSHITPELVSRNRGTTPEALQRELTGDLDNIVMKAMCKDPHQRYASVEELSADIWRHLDGIPISAQTVIMVPGRGRKSDATGEVASIAVLPFQNLHFVEETGEELLGIGLADALITRLSNVKTIIVRPTSAVLKYTDADRDLLTAGYELNVDSVLDGRIQHLGERIRVTVQLVSMGNGAPMWAAQFVERFTDILSVQDSLSEQVAQALSEKLSGEERQRLARRYTDNPEAYQAYLQGRQFANKYAEESLHNAIGFFAEAIRIDPQYALAHAGVADYYNWLGVWGVLSPDKSVALAKESALRALDIDDTLAEAHASLAFARWSYDRDWTGAVQGFRRAIELNPNYATTHHWYGFLLSALGRHEEAVAELKRAQIIEPLSVGISSGNAFVLHLAGRGEEATEQLRRSLELEPQSYIAQQGLAWAYSRAGRHPEALAAIEKAVAQAGRVPLLLWTLGRVHACAGRSEEALAIVEELKELYRKYYVSPYYIGFIYAILEMRDEAFQWFEEAYHRRDFWVLWLRVEPLFEHLHGDARFQNLTGRIIPAESSTRPSETVHADEQRRERNSTGELPAAKTRKGWPLSRAATVASSLALAAVAAAALFFYWRSARTKPLVNRLITSPLRITNHPATDWQPDWSPDGSQVAFASNRDGKLDIYLMDADGNNPRRLTHNSVDDFAPVWSPDGKRIAFTSKRDGNDEIYVMNADGSNQTNVSQNMAADSRPAWSPDAKRIAFTSNRDGEPDTYDIYAMSADGSNQLRLTDDPNFDSDPTWSPDGKRITFASNRNGNFEVYVMNADGGDQRNLTNNLSFDGKPVWSPDGKLIAFTGNRDSESSNFDLYVMNSDGSSQRKVTNNPATDDEPSWSPDSTSLVFQTDRDVNYEIYVTNILAPLEAGGVARHRTGVRSIAVLPFDTLEAVGNDEYLGVGLADALTGKLGQITQIEARPSSAVRRYLGTETEAVQAGRELGVDYVLDGTIQHLGERVHVSAELISVGDGKTSWAEKFDENFTDILTLQESISERVVRAMTLELTNEEKQRLGKRYTENGEAYQLYLVGRYHLGKRTLEGLKQAINSFEQAIKKDDRYALAYAGLADCYALLNWYSLPPPPDAFPRAKQAALKALEFDDGIAEAHASLAFITLYGERDWTGAEREFRRAIELNPNYATAHHWYAFNLAAMGRLPESLNEIKRARELDQRSVIINTAVGNVYYYARRYDQAIEQCRKALEMDPGFVPAHTVLRWSLEKKGMYEEAYAAYQQEKTFAGDSPLMRARLAHVHASAGKQPEARRILDELIAQRKRQWVSAYEIAVVYAILADNDRALEWLDTAAEERSIGFLFIRVDPDLDNIRNDPRFLQLLRSRNFLS